MSQCNDALLDRRGVGGAIAGAGKRESTPVPAQKIGTTEPKRQPRRTHGMPAILRLRELGDSLRRPREENGQPRIHQSYPELARVCGVSVTQVWRAVRVSELFERFLELENFRHLTIARVDAVLALPPKEQERALRRAEQEGASRRDVHHSRIRGSHCIQNKDACVELTHAMTVIEQQLQRIAEILYESGSHAREPNHGAVQRKLAAVRRKLRALESDDDQLGVESDSVDNLSTWNGVT